MIDKYKRVCKRPTTAKKRQAATDARLLEALEREEAQGTKPPEHLKAIKENLKGATA